MHARRYSRAPCSQTLDTDTHLKDDGGGLSTHTSFLDGRAANLYILMQCAAGKHWVDKQQIALDRWAGYLDWPRGSLVAGMATVQFVDPTRWHDLNLEFGVLVDRVRIHKTREGMGAGTRAAVEGWVEERAGEVLEGWVG